MLDAAQTVGHVSVNVEQIGCDFLALSGHKMFGPSGIGALYLRRDLQASMQNYRYGGGMVNKVQQGDVSYQSGPGRFEAGTPNIEGAIGLGAAIDYLNSLGGQWVQEHDQDLERYFRSQIQAVRNIEVAFPSRRSTCPFSLWLPLARWISVLSRGFFPIVTILP